MRVKTDAFEFLSDGIKAYLIYPDDEEIEVAATDEEASLSPADILKNYQNGYSYKMAGRATDQGKVIQYIRLRPISSEEVKEILIGVNMKTMLLDNYKQFGTNGSNNIFSVDNYEVNATLDHGILQHQRARVFRILSPLTHEQARQVCAQKFHQTPHSYGGYYGVLFSHANGMEVHR